jgi:hypothetical protein
MQDGSCTPNWMSGRTDVSVLCVQHSYRLSGSLWWRWSSMNWYASHLDYSSESELISIQLSNDYLFLVSVEGGASMGMTNRPAIQPITHRIAG